MCHAMVPWLFQDTVNYLVELNMKVIGELIQKEAKLKKLSAWVGSKMNYTFNYVIKLAVDSSREMFPI